MDIAVTAELEREEWSRIVREDDTCTFFHTPEWSGVLADTLPGFVGRVFAARAGGRAVGVLPAMSRRRGALSTLESMPFGTFGGPALAKDAPDGTREALLTAFARAGRATSVGFVQLVDRSNSVDPGAMGGFRRMKDTVQLVRLEGDAETLRSAYKPSARNKIRKAEKAGVTVRRAEGEADFLAYLEVLTECGREWSIRPRPGREFFTALSRLDPRMVQMWLAEHEGRVIGGDLNFVLHGTIMNWGNVSTDAAKSLAPSNLLHATAIETGAAEGHHTYDLGSSPGLSGVRAFKASFGAVEVAVSRYVLDKGWYRVVRRLAGRGREGTG